MGFLPSCTGHVNLYESGKEPLAFPSVIPFSLSHPPSVVFATLHPVGFRAVLPSCDGGKAQGPPSQLWGRTQELGVRRVLYSKQGRPAGLPRKCLVPFFLLCVVGHRCCCCCCCCCCAPVGQRRRSRARADTSQPSPAQPASPPAGCPWPAGGGGMMLMMTMIGATWVV